MRFRDFLRCDDRYLHAALGLQNLERNLVTVPADPEVDAGRAELEILQGHLVEKRRDPRLAQADFTAPRFEFEAEQGLDQRERRRTRPGLRRAGHRVERRSAAALALEAAEEFGQAPQIHIGGGIEQPLEHLLDGIPEARAIRALSCGQIEPL
jgi:hypothetical protein